MTMPLPEHETYEDEAPQAHDEGILDAPAMDAGWPDAMERPIDLRPADLSARIEMQGVSHECRGSVFHR